MIQIARTKEAQKLAVLWSGRRMENGLPEESNVGE